METASDRLRRRLANPPSGVNGHEAVLRSITPIWNYGTEPKLFFREKCVVEIASVKDTSQKLFCLLQGELYYLPAPLIRLCNEYIACSMHSLAQEVIDECDAFKISGGIQAILQSRPDLRVALQRYMHVSAIDQFSREMDERVRTFRLWFRVRQEIPAFISLNLSLKLDFNKHLKEVTVRDGNDIVCSLQLQNDADYIVLRTHIWTFRRMPVSDFHREIVRHLPRLEFITPCLNTEKCTETDLNECAAAIAKTNLKTPKSTAKKNRPRAAADRWRHIISKIVVVLAATREMIESCGELSEGFRSVQPLLKLEWNKFQNKYGFGAPFVL
jgi:hypothetical protein